MAFGKSSGGHNFPPGTKVYYGKIKTKDLPAPIIEIKKKEGDDMAIVDPAAKFVSGNLISIHNKEFKHDKKVIKSVSAAFQDKDEVVFLSIPHTYLGRNILNSLLALKTFNGVEIGVYQSKPKPDAKDQRGFPSSAVRQNGELVYGKFKKEELPEIPKVKVGSELYSDDTAITAFFVKQVEELGKVIKANAPAGANVKTSHGADDATGEAEGSGEEAPEGDDNKLPF